MSDATSDDGNGDAATVDYWEDRYSQGKTGWDRGGPSPALLDWLGRDAAPGPKVLIPGCGRGYEVVELARRGFSVTAIDFAEAPLRSLRSQLEKASLTAELVCGNVLSFTAEAFDWIYEQTCLCAIPPRQWTAYEARLAGWVRAEGVVLAQFMQTGQPGGPPFDCDLQAMRRLFDASRWTWPHEMASTSHPAGLTELSVPLVRRHG